MRTEIIGVFGWFLGENGGVAIPTLGSRFWGLNSPTEEEGRLGVAEQAIKEAKAHLSNARMRGWER